MKYCRSCQFDHFWLKWIKNRLHSPMFPSCRKTAAGPRRERSRAWYFWFLQPTHSMGSMGLNHPLICPSWEPFGQAGRIYSTSQGQGSKHPVEGAPATPAEQVHSLEKQLIWWGLWPPLMGGAQYKMRVGGPDPEKTYYPRTKRQYTLNMNLTKSDRVHIVNWSNLMTVIVFAGTPPLSRPSHRSIPALSTSSAS